MKVFNVYTNKNSTETTRNSRKRQYCVGNIKTIISQAADNSLGGKQSGYTKEKVKNMGYCSKINCTTKIVVYKKYVQTKTVGGGTEYRCRRATAKREIRRDIVKLGNCITLRN